MENYLKAGILTDLTKCVGCGACAVMCKQVNNLPGGIARQLDAYTWTLVEKQKGVYIRRQCMHCLEAACVSVCPVGALTRNRLGAVIYNQDKCIGCRYCIMACPFDIPKYQWNSRSPLVGKCIFCAEKRLKEGRQPGCTQVCPTGATIFGDRQTLMAEARRRIRKYPNRYIGHIYGEREAGGTSVLYLSALPFEQLGFKQGLRQKAYPELTRKMIRDVPIIGGVGGVALFGVMWVINRRIELKRQQQEAEKDKD